MRHSIIERLIDRSAEGRGADIGAEQELEEYARRIGQHCYAQC